MTTPTPSALSAADQQLQESQKTQACPKARPNRRLHRSAAPRRQRATAPERAQAAFSFGPCTAQPLAALPLYGCGVPLAGAARFLFGQGQ